MDRFSRDWLPAPAELDADHFVNAAHHDSSFAIEMLALDPSLATLRSSWGETPLEAASHLGHRRLICALVDAGADLDIFAACALGMRVTACRLMSTIPVDGLGVHLLPMLHFGIQSRDIGTVRLLLEAGMAVNPCGASLPPLHSAVAAGSARMVRLLLTAGADVRATDAFGSTALDWALALDGTQSGLIDLLAEAATAKDYART